MQFFLMKEISNLMLNQVDEQVFKNSAKSLLTIRIFAPMQKIIGEIFVLFYFIFLYRNYVRFLLKIDPQVVEVDKVKARVNIVILKNNVMIVCFIGSKFHPKLGKG